ncbi:MAG: hypothetical protein HKN15_13365 [Xanthomonadales bacterium]|nr:hypothetical protein [Xanthomonadales bacterium]
MFLLRVLPLSALALFTSLALAEEWPTDEELANAEQQTLEVEGEADAEEAADEEDPYLLDTLIVTSEQFTFEQEVALRLVRRALDTPRSHKRKDKDAWVCRFRAPVGRHRKHIECARNGDLMAVSFNPVYPTYYKDRAPEDQFGKIWMSQRAVLEKPFREMLERMPGSADFDREFVALALAGQHPPRDIPTEEELDDFAATYAAVTRLHDQGASEDAQMKAISDGGFTLARYNRIVDLVEIYQSIENEVARRLARLSDLASEHLGSE